MGWPFHSSNSLAERRCALGVGVARNRRAPAFRYDRIICEVACAACRSFETRATSTWLWTEWKKKAADHLYRCRQAKAALKMRDQQERSQRRRAYSGRRA